MIHEKPKSKRKRKNYRVYGQFTPAMRFALFLVWLFLILLLIGAIVSFFVAFREPSIWGIVSVLLASLAIFGMCVWGIWRLYGMIFHNYIRVNDEGIDYYFCGAIGFARWDELEYIEHRTYGGGTRIWGILTTRTTAYWSGYYTEAFGYARYFKGMIPLSLIGSIPLPKGYKSKPDVNLRKFKETAFGKELYNHAPHLFDEIEKEQNH